jgi:hypothetical protein
MISITLTDLSIDTASPSIPVTRLRGLLHRLAAWRRHRNYPTVRRARREAVFAWSAAMVRHSSMRH